jgi:hypothetical protein
MPFEEKVTWVSAFVSLIVTGVYSWTILGRLGSMPVAEIAYQVPMLIAIGTMIVMTIVVTIAVAIGAAVSAELTRPGSAKGIDHKDERDVDIHRRGDLFGYYVLSVGVLGAMALAMLRYDQFWIANALLLSFVIASLVSSTVKIVSYHRGF